MDKQKLFILKYKRDKWFIKIAQLVIIIMFLSIWQILANKNLIDIFIFSSPKEIFLTIGNLFRDYNLLSHISITIIEVLISLILGLLISFIISSLRYLFKTFNAIIDPFLTVLNSLPKVALGPLLIIWFGANYKTIIIMALLINVIVSSETLYSGYLKTNKTRILLYKSFKKNNLKIFKDVVIPSSKESIIASYKISLAMSFIGVIMGEFLTSKKGLGYLIIYGTQIFNLRLVISCIFILLIISYLMYLLIIFITKKSE